MADAVDLLPGVVVVACLLEALHHIAALLLIVALPLRTEVHHHIAVHLRLTVELLLTVALPPIVVHLLLIAEHLLLIMPLRLITRLHLEAHLILPPTLPLILHPTALHMLRHMVLRLTLLLMLRLIQPLTQPLMRRVIQHLILPPMPRLIWRLIHLLMRQLTQPLIQPLAQHLIRPLTARPLMVPLPTVHLMAPPMPLLTEPRQVIIPARAAVMAQNTLLQDIQVAVGGEVLLEAGTTPKLGYHRRVDDIAHLDPRDQSPVELTRSTIPKQPATTFTMPENRLQAVLTRSRTRRQLAITIIQLVVNMLEENPPLDTMANQTFTAALGKLHLRDPPMPRAMAIAA